MKVNLDKQFDLNAGQAAAWALLSDIPRVAACMPGAEITDTVDERHHKGRVRVKIGPVSTALNGSIEVQEVAAGEHRIRLLGKGGDTKGSRASMDLTAHIEGDARSSQLIGNAVVTLSGHMATYGGRMVNQVADQILNQFGANFAAQLEPVAAAAEHGQEPAPPPPTAELNALALLWGIVTGFFKRLFGGKQ